MRSAIAVILAIAIAVVAATIACVIFGWARWGSPLDPIALVGTYLLYFSIFASPLLPVGLAALWLARFTGSPRPIGELAIWAGAGAILLHVFWGPVLDGIADVSPTRYGGLTTALIAFACAILGLTTWAIDRHLARRRSDRGG
jgi:hypothetical protein